ncbi:unnamed protein product [Pipistrellus nathusii]|uniref:Uncharacterized protein n=1 Tax=Pipistrellus nathusii TaxID=59473 RepID=A0ABN9ZV30_PIPNA
MCAQKPVGSATAHTETCAFSLQTQDGGHLTPALLVQRQETPSSRCRHRWPRTSQGQTEVETTAAKQKPFVTSSLQSPGCSQLRPDPVPSFCPFVISNAHLFPLIKGIIIYNFLLKNQLCILSIADRNSQLVTWLEKIDRNSSLWKEKKRLSKIIYRCKKPCCRTFSNYEDSQQCSKIKDSSKIIALGFQTQMPPLSATPRVLAHVTECVCTHSEGVTGF